MSGNKVTPLFTNASRLKLKISGQDIAFAIGFNVNLNIGLEPVYVVGHYGPVAIEPTSYSPVTGTLQIIRTLSGSYYDQFSESGVKGINDLYNHNTAVQPNSALLALDKDNDSQKKLVNAIQSQPGINDSNAITSLANLQSHLDPDQVLASSTFDLDVYIKVPVLPSDSSAVAGATGVLLGQLTDQKATLIETRLMTIYQCRLSGRNTNIALGQLVNEPLSFQGIWLSHAVNDTDIINMGSGLADIQT